MTEASPSRVPNEEFEFEALWSELHSLKKLYGLLQKSNSKIPSEDDNYDNLDEKSRVVLRKLLDAASHQALQSQAKVVFHTPEPPNSLQKAENTGHKVTSSVDRKAGKQEEPLKCHRVSEEQSKQESSQGSDPPAEAKLRQPTKQPEFQKLQVAESNLGRKPQPNFSRCDLARQNSRKSTAVSHKRPTNYHRQRPHVHHHEPSSRPRMRNNNSKEQNQAAMVVKEQVKPVQSNGELLAITPAKKRARAEPACLVDQFTANQICAMGQVDRELMHSKRGDPKEGPSLQRSCRKPPSRLGSLKDREARSIVVRDPNQTAGDRKGRPQQLHKSSSGGHSRLPSRLGSLKDREAESIAARDRNQTAGDRNGTPQQRQKSSGGPHSRPPSRLGSLRGRECKSIAARDLRKPAVQSRLRSIGYSSSSQTMRSESSATTGSLRSRCPIVRRAAPPRPPPPTHRKKVGPPPKKPPAAEEETKEEGKLERLKNKLGVIFHHHHHHHHHIVGGGGRQVNPPEHGGSHSQHRSPWAYFKSVVHHTSRKEKRNEAVKAGPAARRLLAQPRQQPQRQGQHGYFYALLEGLIRHVWGMGRAKREGKRVAGRVAGGKKLHWWQRFRRRGGVKLANKKTPRLRLGFNKAPSRSNRNKKG